MVDLDFQVDGAEPVRHAASPLLALKLRIRSSGTEQRIHSILLRCQVQIEAVRRAYSAGERSGLSDLFGPPEEWGRTLRTLLWTHVNVGVPGFTGETTVDLPLPCTWDFNVAATKYLHALEGGELPLCLLFSGTVFYQPAHPPVPLQVGQISWNKETTYRLPVRVWRELMDHYYPGQAWLCLQKGALERLGEYRRRHGLTGWEEAIEHLLESARSASASSEGTLAALTGADQRGGTG